jgi:hypothetical protein
MFNILRKEEERDDIWPDQGFLNRAAEEVMHTPDTPLLLQREYQVLFVYGRMMSRMPDYEKIKENVVAQFRGYTQPDYAMWIKRLGSHSYPIALPPNSELEWEGWTDPRGGEPASILGELMFIESRRIIQLDREMQNGVQFLRIPVHTILPYRNVLYIKERRYIEEVFGKYFGGKSVLTSDWRLMNIKAWMYMGNPDYWVPQLDAGFSFTPSKIFRPNNPRLKNYYFFPPTKENGAI